jgi:hypothetical protein
MGHGTSERVLRLYEQCLEGCENRSTADVSRALLALIATLNFEEASSVAEGFYRLYSYCLRKAIERQFDRIAWILGGLRESWMDAAPATASRAGDTLAS